MPFYTYVARNRQGKEVRGSQEASSFQDLMVRLKEEGLTLIESQQARGKKADQSKVGGLRVKVKTKALIPFTHQLRVIYGSGISLLSGIRDLAKDTKDAALKKVLLGVALALEDGASLAQALRAYPKVFTPLYISLVEVGEATGELDVILERLSFYLERAEETKSRITQALIYPAILIVAVLALITVLLTFLLPKLTKIYEGAKVTLPWPTRVVKGASHILILYWPYLLLALALLVVAYILGRKTPSLREAMDRFYLSIPVLGELILKDNTSSFAYTLATLNKSGVDISESLDLTAKVIKNRHLQMRILDAKREIEGGATVADALEGTHAFPSLIISMIGVGEASGKLDETLEKVCEFYDRDVELTIKRAMSIIEPAIVAGAGVVVGFILLATLMPIYKLISALR